MKTRKLVSQDQLLAIITVASILLIGASLVGTVNKISTGNTLAATAEVFQQEGSGDSRVLILGDSLAYGVGASEPEKSFAGRIGAELPNASIVNKAEIGAETQTLANDIKQLVDGNFQASFIIIGGNDVIRPSADMMQSRRNLESILSHVSSKSQHTFLITTSSFTNVSVLPIDVNDYYLDRSKQLRDSSIELASQYSNVDYLDVFDVDYQLYKSFEAPDGYHLNDQGIQALVDLIDFRLIRG